LTCRTPAPKTRHQCDAYQRGTAAFREKSAFRENFNG
jgi:hypothetical protein